MTDTMTLIIQRDRHEQALVQELMSELPSWLVAKMEETYADALYESILELAEQQASDVIDETNDVMGED